MRRLFVNLTLLMAFSATTLSAQDFWRQTQGPEGGQILALSVNADGHVFVGTNWGGVYRSTDRSLSWEQIGLAGRQVWALIISDSNYVFAGTSGFFWSKDNGRTWTDTGLDEGVYGLTSDSQGHFFAATYDGMYRYSISTNAWTQINVGFTTDYAYSLAITTDEILFAGTNIGVFRSTNGGDSWIQVESANHSIYALAVNSIGDIIAGS